MGNKLIKNIEDETWRKFTGYCKAKNKKVSELLNEILKDYLEGKIE